MTAVERLLDVKVRLARAERDAGRAPGSVRLIVVSKTFVSAAISPLLAAGVRDFGENRVQEAKAKWPELKADFADVRLDLVGPLQSNKAPEAVALFDTIHSIDRDKIAAAIAQEIARQGRRLDFFVQVNTGAEPQKAGVAPEDAVAFVERCRSVHGVAVVGLMAIPPEAEAPGPHFALLAKLAREAGLPRLSMGMSGDFETAIGFGATDVRIGSAILGERAKAG